MAVIQLPLEDIETLVVRPVILAVTKSLLDHLQIDPKTNVRYNGAEDTSWQPGSTLGTKESQVGINTWNSSESIRIEVSTGHSKERLGGPTHNSLASPIFMENNIGLYLSPTYFTQDVQLRLIYKASSRSSANTWRDLMIQRYRDGFNLIHHQASYTYLIPDFFFAFTGHAFGLMQSQAAYENLDYKNWFYQNASSKVGPVTNQGATKTAIGVSETQVGIMTSYEENPLDVKSEKVDNTNAYTTELVFKFNFDKPYTLRMEYPCVIHNQVVNDIFIPQYDQYTAEDFVKSQFSSMNGLSYFSNNQMDSRANAMQGIVIPAWDDYRLKYTLPDTATVFTALCTVSEDDPYTLLDLKDLGDFQLSSELLNWISTSEYANITGKPSSVIVLSLYENDFLCSQEVLSVTKDCMVISKKDLDLRKTYHVRFAFYTNIYTVGIQAHQRLVDSGISSSFVHFLEYQTSGYNTGVETFNHERSSSVDLKDYWSGKYPLPMIRNWHGFYVQTFFKVSENVLALNPEANDFIKQKLIR
jgi:hypothetical protein